MVGDRWPDKSCPPFTKRSLLPPSTPAKPKKTALPRRPPLIPKPAPPTPPKQKLIDYEDYGPIRRVSLKKTIERLVRADPARMPQSISAELEEGGYEASLTTVASVRRAILGPYGKKR